MSTPAAMDTIFLSDLRVETVIGIFDWERKIRQTVSIDLEMAADIRRAAASDAIEDTLDYKAVAKRLIGFVEASDFGLVETLAEHIARIVVTEFDVPRVKVTLHKPGAVRGSKDVGILIERAAADYAEDDADG
jgi:dihydroneopterin aldolase